MVTFDNNSFAVIEEIKHELFHLILRSDGIVQMNTYDEAYFTIKDSWREID